MMLGMVPTRMGQGLKSQERVEFRFAPKLAKDSSVSW